jgi:hypothetical protein
MDEFRGYGEVEIVGSKKLFEGKYADYRGEGF